MLLVKLPIGELFMSVSNTVKRDGNLPKQDIQIEINASMDKLHLQKRKVSMLLKRYRKEVDAASPLMHHIAKHLMQIKMGNASTKSIELSEKKDDITSVDKMGKTFVALKNLRNLIWNRARNKVLRVVGMLIILVILDIALMITPLCIVKEMNTLTTTLYVITVLIITAGVALSLVILVRVYRSVKLRNRVDVLLADNSVQNFKKLLDRLSFSHKDGDHFFHNIKEADSDDTEYIDDVYSSTINSVENTL